MRRAWPPCSAQSRGPRRGWGGRCRCSAASAREALCSRKKPRRSGAPAAWTALRSRGTSGRDSAKALPCSAAGSLGPGSGTFQVRSLSYSTRRRRCQEWQKATHPGTCAPCSRRWPAPGSCESGCSACPQGPRTSTRLALRFEVQNL